MKLIPTWPIAVACLVIGLGSGAYIDYTIMQGRIDKLTAEHTEQLRVREVQRAKDEAAARDVERQLSIRAGEIEQRKNDEIATVRTSADALIARLRQQANSKPACPGRLPQATASGEAAAGAVVPERVGEDFIRLAERADQLRAALDACYSAYDSVGR